MRDLNVDEFLRGLENKLNKVTFEKFKEQCEIKLKGVRLNEKSITRLEKFVENLALAISNMEKHMNLQ